MGNKLSVCKSVNLLLIESQLSRQGWTDHGCFYAISIVQFLFKLSIEFFFSCRSTWINFFNYYCLVNHTLRKCSLGRCCYHISLDAKLVVKGLFDKLNDIHSKYRLVDCFCYVILISYNGSVCATKRQNLDVVMKVIGHLSSSFSLQLNPTKVVSWLL